LGDRYHPREMVDRYERRAVAENYVGLPFA
jgi:hypothetical protein